MERHRARRVHRGLTVVLLVVTGSIGCRPDVDPHCPLLVGGTPERPLLIGARARRAADVLVDPAATLSVLVASPPPPESAWHWTSHDGRRATLGVRVTSTGAGEGLRVSTSTTPAGLGWGEGTLSLHAGSHACAAWTLRGGPPSAGERAVDAAIAVAREREKSAGEVEAEAAWNEVARRADAEQLNSVASRARRAAAFMAIRARRFGAAFEHLSAARAHQASLGEGPWSAQLAYAEALLAQGRGDLTGADQRFGEAIARAERLDMSAELPTYGEARALALLAGSRYEEALSTLGAAPTATTAPGLAPAERARRLINHAWAHLRARGVSRAASLAQIDDWLSSALALLDPGTLPQLRANALHKRAVVARERGDWPEVAALVRAYWAVPSSTVSFVRPAVELLEAEHALETGALDRAAAAYAGVERRGEAEDTVASDVVWRARAGRAEVARRAGRLGEAVALYRAALEALDAVARYTSALAPRAQFLADRGRVVRDALAVFAEAGAWEEAVQAIEDDQRRLVDSLRAPGPTESARAAWDDALDELEIRRRDHDAALARTRYAARAERAPLAAAARAQQEAAERGLLDALAAVDRLRPQAPRLRVADIRAGLEARELLRVAWSCDGDACERVVWVTRAGLSAGPREPFVADTTYEVRLGDGPASAPEHVRLLLPSQLVTSRRARVRSGPMYALVDPDGSLPGARAEGEAVARLLPGLVVQRGEEVSRARVLDALRDARLVHYAGHVDVPTASPWDVSLRLADGAAVRLADLLAARPQVDLLVLAACDGARPLRLADDRTLSLAEILMATGARVVVAARGRVSDAGSRVFLERLYREGVLDAPAAAFARAQATTIAEGGEPARAAAAFELWGVP